MKISKTSPCTIELMDKGNPVHAFAARELRRILVQVLGGGIGKEAAGKICLSSGNSQTDGFTVALNGQTLELKGDNPRSLLYAVYAFAKRFCGAAWFSPDSELLPARKEIDITLNKEWREASPYAKRNIFPEGNRFSYDLAKKFVRWAPRNCISDITFSFNAWLRFGEKLSPQIEKRGLSLNLSGHCLPMFVPTSDFEKHPEYFALVDGKRVPNGQYCFSSKGFRDKLANAIFSYISSQPLLRGMAVWAEDNSLLCECPECRKKGFLKSFIDCIDSIAGECKEKFPPVSVSVLAYNAALAWDMLEPEPGISPENCSLQMAYWGRDYSQDLGKSNCEGDQRAFQAISDWRAQTSCPNSILEYYTDLWMLTHLLSPMPERIQRDCREYARMGIDELGTLVCIASPDMEVKARTVTKYAPLVYENLYFFAAFSWDPEQSVMQVVDSYCETLYGPAAGLCQSYIQNLSELPQQVSKFNRALFRLRFVDVWVFDATPEEGGIKFLPQEWSPDQPQTEAHRLRHETCRRLVLMLSEAEQKNGWDVKRLDSRQRENVRALRNRWNSALERLRVLLLQLDAQDALRTGNREQAQESLQKALSSNEGLLRHERARILKLLSADNRVI